MNLHYCLLDEECREYGPPSLYIHLRRGSIVLAIPPIWRVQDWSDDDTVLTDKRKWAWNKPIGWIPKRDPR